MLHHSIGDDLNSREQSGEKTQTTLSFCSDALVVKQENEKKIANNLAIFKFRRSDGDEFEVVEDNGARRVIKRNKHEVKKVFMEVELWHTDSLEYIFNDFVRLKVLILIPSTSALGGLELTARRTLFLGMTKEKNCSLKKFSRISFDGLYICLCGFVVSEIFLPLSLRFSDSAIKKMKPQKRRVVDESFYNISDAEKSICCSDDVIAFKCIALILISINVASYARVYRIPYSFVPRRNTFTVDLLVVYKRRYL
jgi:hypothetical protein